MRFCFRLRRRNLQKPQVVWVVLDFYQLKLLRHRLVLPHAETTFKVLIRGGSIVSKVLLHSSLLLLLLVPLSPLMLAHLLSLVFLMQFGPSMTSQRQLLNRVQ